VEIKGADKECDIQQILGWPSLQALITALQGNQILNFLITADDMSRAAAIYGQRYLFCLEKWSRDANSTNPPPIRNEL